MTARKGPYSVGLRTSSCTRPLVRVSKESLDRDRGDPITLSARTRPLTRTHVSEF
jgi:hypothetical protein